MVKENLEEQENMLVRTVLWLIKELGLRRVRSLFLFVGPDNGYHFFEPQPYDAMALHA